jgi:hypothetical protein
MLSSRDGQRLLAFWMEQLSGDLPVIQLPSEKCVSLFLSRRFCCGR